MRRNLQESILTELKRQPGMMVTAQDLQQTLGLNRTQVMGATNQLAQAGLIDKVKTGVFRFDGAPQTQNPLYELIARSSNGDLVLQDEDGTVIVARPIT